MYLGWWSVVEGQCPLWFDTRTRNKLVQWGEHGKHSKLSLVDSCLRIHKRLGRLGCGISGTLHHFTSNIIEFHFFVEDLSQLYKSGSPRCRTGLVLCASLLSCPSCPAQKRLWFALGWLPARGGGAGSAADSCLLSNLWDDCWMIVEWLLNDCWMFIREDVFVLCFWLLVPPPNFDMRQCGWAPFARWCVWKTPGSFDWKSRGWGCNCATPFLLATRVETLLELGIAQWLFFGGLLGSNISRGWRYPFHHARGMFDLLDTFWSDINWTLYFFILPWQIACSRL